MQIVAAMDTDSNSTIAPTCDLYPDAPYDFVRGATFNHAGYPVICGGLASYEPYTYLDQCWRAEDNGWVQLASMAQKREFLAGVELNDKEFWVTGELKRNPCNE